MKKGIRETAKTKSPSAGEKNTRPFTTKKNGYQEEVYNKEEQSTYEKSNLAKDSKKNTSGPES